MLRLIMVQLDYETRWVHTDADPERIQYCIELANQEALDGAIDIDEDSRFDRLVVLVANNEHGEWIHYFTDASHDTSECCEVYDMGLGEYTEYEPETFIDKIKRFW